MQRYLQLHREIAIIGPSVCLLCRLCEPRVVLTVKCQLSTHPGPVIFCQSSPKHRTQTMPSIHQSIKYKKIRALSVILETGST